MLKKIAVIIYLVISLLPAAAQQSVEGKWVSHALTIRDTKPLKGKDKVTLMLGKDNRYTMEYYRYPFMSVTVHYSYSYRDRHLETSATDKYGNNVGKHHKKIRIAGTYTLRNDTILFANAAGLDTARVVKQDGQLLLTETVTVDNRKRTFTIHYKAR